MRRAAADELAATLHAHGLGTLLTFDGRQGYTVQVIGSGERATRKSEALKLLSKIGHRPARRTRRATAAD